MVPVILSWPEYCNFLIGKGNNFLVCLNSNASSLGRCVLVLNGKTILTNVDSESEDLNRVLDAFICFNFKCRLDTPALLC